MDEAPSPRVMPEDEYNEILVANVHPPGWVNPVPPGRYNLVVIGAGTAGLIAAAGAAGLGARVALIEKSFLGGDCLNVGCVPSKTIIRSSRMAQDIRLAGAYGIHADGGPRVDFPAVMERMRRLRSKLSFHDSAERFRSLGVDVYLGEARFTGEDSLEVGSRSLHFRRAVIASGARAARPRLEGLTEAGYLTNETVFTLTERPDRLAVIGGGPLGSELAQAFQRLGSKVSIFHTHEHLLEREDAEAAEILQNAFIREGIQLFLNARIQDVSVSGEGKVIRFDRGSGPESVAVDEILVGAGRVPNVEGLNLDAAGVAYDSRKGVLVNDLLQTSNPRIYAAGDVCLQYKFTHMADAAARIVIQNALFPGRKKLSSLTIPWVTYTDPEIAHVGLYERDAQAKGIAADSFMKSLAEVDRAVVDGEDEGFVKVHVKRGSDKLLGATIVARHAGEMINEVSLAMTQGLGLKALANVIHPYPTQAEALKQTADLYNRSRLTPFAGKVLSLWMGFGRSGPAKMLERWRLRWKGRLHETLAALKRKSFGFFVKNEEGP